jgi:hypothetical protein
MLTGVPYSASCAVVRFDGNVFEGMEWSVDEQGDEFDSTSFEDCGYGDSDVATIQCTIRIKGLWDSLRNPHNAPLVLNPSVSLTNVRLYLSGLASSYWSFPKARVINGITEAKVRTGMTYEVTLKSRGVFYRPL